MTRHVRRAGAPRQDGEATGANFFASGGIRTELPSLPAAGDHKPHVRDRKRKLDCALGAALLATSPPTGRWALASTRHNAPVHEAVVRAAVEARVHAEVARHGPTLVVHELGLCQAEARVDVAAVNGRLVGYEIKTRADTLARLRRQEKVYSRVFDRVWLVADDRHIAAATEMIPGWWGVMRITSKADTCLLTLVRPSRLNRDVDPRSLVRLLWRAEVMSELEVLGLADGLDREPRRVLWEELAGAVPRRLSLPELQKRVRSRLKSREGWRSDRLRKSDGGSS